MFSADGFTRGSIGYTLLTVFVMVVLIGATASFSGLLLFEIYRSVKFAQVFVLARRAEEEAIEEAVLGRRLRRQSVTDNASRRRRSSVLILPPTLPLNGRLERRKSALTCVSAAPAQTAGPDIGSARGAAATEGPLLARLEEVANDGGSPGLAGHRGQGRKGGTSPGFGSGSGPNNCGASAAPASALAVARDTATADVSSCRAVGLIADRRSETPAEARVYAPPPKTPRALSGGPVSPPPPPPQADDWLAPRTQSSPSTSSGRRRVQVDVAAAAVAARSMRVHTMASRHLTVIRSVRSTAQPDSDSPKSK